MDFVVRGLSPEPFRHLYGLSDKDLEAQGAIRYVAEEDSGFPDRIEMRDAYPGETLLLVNHVSMDQKTPYRATHAIFVLEGAKEAYQGENEIPDAMFKRLLSLRAFDANGMMVDAAVATGEDIRIAIGRLFSYTQVAYIHAHNATRGCYSGRIDRR